jgi:hypothetical protein
MLLLPIKQAIAAEHDRAACMVVAVESAAEARAARAVVKRRLLGTQPSALALLLRRQLRRSSRLTRKRRHPAELYEAAVTHSRAHSRYSVCTY